VAKLVYGLQQSLDGYVDHQRLLPTPKLFRHFIEQVRGLKGIVYVRRTYEIMRYWDQDLAEWGTEEQDLEVSKQSSGFSGLLRGNPSPAMSERVAYRLNGTNCDTDTKMHGCLSMGAKYSVLASARSLSRQLA